mmetsp:Transcript_25437/g.64671  ORF Transcript_25437/g.64671 Transcript_25437/m.64671 type:complete len:433 (-) Transcript_25437:354-1652(-)
MYSPVPQAGSVAIELEDAESDAPEPGPSTCFLMAINSFAFAYSCVVCTLGVIILPSEAVRLFREQHAMMLGVMLGCTGVTQLISPAIGYLSDRSTSRYGRRRPLMVMGAIISCAGNVAMLFAREYQLRGMFLAALTTAIAGLNISYACFTALLPDLVPAAHIGRASGTMATMSMLGALLGFSLFGFMLSTVHAYAIYCCVVSVTVGLTCLVAHEKPHSERTPYSCSELLSSYSIDHVAHPDFFWVFVTRTFYYMGVSLQAFVLFMLRDVQKVDDPTYWTSLLSMIGQLSAAVVAIPSGHLSDIYGRKPLVWTACGCMALVYLGFAWTPNLKSVLILGVAYGIGNGVFLSVDYALACDTLPSFESAAQGLGVWGVSAFLGSTSGPLIAAPLLAYFGWTTSPDHYSDGGYVAVNVAGACYVTCAALFLRFVRAR